MLPTGKTNRNYVEIYNFSLKRRKLTNCNFFLTIWHPLCINFISIQKFSKKTSHILSKLSLRYSETPVIFLIIFAKQRQCNLNRCLLQNVRYKKWSIHVSFSFQKMHVMWTHRCQWFRNNMPQIIAILPYSSLHLYVSNL